ncbi:Mechanosensitive ion channel [Clavibacter michiganensis subsp. michiganensis]|uniref:Mechanosensitive ion channel n=1 Tax=Clavibacter michiganensis subsp. michiganensis TaxID=33013 RepID=A0A251XGK5_CLAMM|nr:Mechanosensitive ion channel [Clavibacter michiganensis subsp. michiganensis]OUE01679.1 Mechanosensitive ion channel [Clavibacter michiganensis subsp. michiganensis]
MQLAFSDAIRVDDVVIVETEWGRVEEITLTYVVVHIWDDRRMVLPSTYFTTTPFQNWTRTKSELLGAVELDLDWRATPASMREELDRVLATTDLWDGRVSVLQVTDAVGGYVRIRVLVSAVDAPTLFDLRCLVRERLVAFLHEHSPQSLPRTRVQMVDPHEHGDAPGRGGARPRPSRRACSRERRRGTRARASSPGRSPLCRTPSASTSRSTATGGARTTDARARARGRARPEGVRVAGWSG